MSRPIIEKYHEPPMNIIMQNPKIIEMMMKMNRLLRTKLAPGCKNPSKGSINDIIYIKMFSSAKLYYK